jgi:hypothetical protein
MTIASCSVAGTGRLGGNMPPSGLRASPVSELKSETRARLVEDMDDDVDGGPPPDAILCCAALCHEVSARAVRACVCARIRVGTGWGVGAPARAACHHTEGVERYREGARSGVHTHGRGTTRLSPSPSGGAGPGRAAPAKYRFIENSCGITTLKLGYYSQLSSITPPRRRC